RGAERGRNVDQVGKIGKVAMPPIALRANAIELNGDSPGALRQRVVALKGGRDVLGRGFRKARVSPVRADRLENARQYGPVHLPVATKPVIVCGFDAPLGGLLENRVHECVDAYALMPVFWALRDENSRTRGAC